MSIFKTLKIAEVEKGTADPFLSAKTRLIQNLEIQLKCAEAMVNGKAYTVPSTKTVTDADGVKKTVNVPHAPRHWYWRDSEGKVRFCIKVLNKRIEIEKGKTDIIVGKDKELPKTVKSLLDAANTGEFDELLKHAVAQRKKRKTS